MFLDSLSRRRFLHSGLLSPVVAQALLDGSEAIGSEANVSGVLGSDVNLSDHGIEVLFPRNRVPLSFIIDDSTCLVNMGHFCTPQFAAAWPERGEYQKPWQQWPREIPDSFVREFGEWCALKGVRGKYSIVPNPACVGWLDRELPGWSRKQLQESLRLVQELMLPNWDIHPEMITHTRVIDLKTGRPVREIHAGTMENSYPQEKKSVDELAAYLAYALRILKQCDLPCEGVTTPGGFGNQVKSELSLAAGQAIRDVYQVDLPHYFKYVHTDDQSTEPIIENLRGAGTLSPQMTVNVPAGTGDWFGGWQGDRISEPDRYANQDATAGRMVELIQRRQPAVMLCHWPGMYSNGTKEGFISFKRVVESIESRFGKETLWMKVSEIARYWAAKSVCMFRGSTKSLVIECPIQTSMFTIRIKGKTGPVISHGFSAKGDQSIEALREVKQAQQLEAGCWMQEGGDLMVCIDLNAPTIELRLTS